MKDALCRSLGSPIKTRKEKAKNVIRDSLRIKIAEMGPFCTTLNLLSHFESILKLRGCSLFFTRGVIRSCRGKVSSVLHAIKPSAAAAAAPLGKKAASSSAFCPSLQRFFSDSFAYYSQKQSPGSLGRADFYLRRSHQVNGL